MRLVPAERLPGWLDHAFNINSPTITTMPPRIVVRLPDDRFKEGMLELLNSAGQTVATPLPALGRADGDTAKKKKNPQRSPIFPYGDTPKGHYKVVSIFRTGDGTSYPAKNYGENGAIRLQPVEGEAKLAADVGRTGLLIHGGEPGAGGKLRPTNGCVRLSNADMKALIGEIIFLMATEGGPDRCDVDVRKGFTVEISAPDEGYDEGDPPPDPGDDAILP